MLAASDVGLVASAMTAVNAPPSLIEEITELLNSNSQDLKGQIVTEVSPGWFGGSTTGHRIGVNTSMAHQAVEEEFQKLADALREYSAAINQWANEVRDVDGTTNAELNARASALAEVGTALDDAREESASTTMGDGSYQEPTTEGGA